MDIDHWYWAIVHRALILSYWKLSTDTEVLNIERWYWGTDTELMDIDHRYWGNGHRSLIPSYCTSSTDTELLEIGTDTELLNIERWYWVTDTELMDIDNRYWGNGHRSLILSYCTSSTDTELLEIEHWIWATRYRALKDIAGPEMLIEISFVRTETNQRNLFGISTHLCNFLIVFMYVHS